MLASRRRFSPYLSILLCGFALTTAAAAQSFTAGHAKVSLISEDNSLHPGKTALVGVLFDLEKGWHIYWVNPGDSGEPPKMQWHLPAGFQAQAVRWPTPVRLGAGKVIDYGYEGRVLLPVPIQVPAGYQPTTAVTLSADIRYLICREVCIPAKAQASLSIPSAKTSAGGDAGELFRSALDNSPKPWPAGWKAQVSDNGGFLLLSLETGTSEPRATFFPLEEDQIDNSAVQGIAANPRGVALKLKKSDQLQKPISTLKGVVVLGPGRAFEVSAPMAGKR